MNYNYNPANYITKLEAQEALHISKNTLGRWMAKGLIRKYKVHERKVLCNAEDVYRILNMPANVSGMTVIYARVSKQCDIDKLREQELQVSTFAIKNGIQIDKIYSDVCPSYSFDKKKRSQFFELMKDIHKYRIKNIYILSPDRITRFGTEMFEEICKFHKINVIYLSPDIADMYCRDEVRDEVLLILKQLKTMYNI